MPFWGGPTLKRQTHIVHGCGSSVSLAATNSESRNENRFAWKYQQALFNHGFISWCEMDFATVAPVYVCVCVWSVFEGKYHSWVDFQGHPFSSFCVCLKAEPPPHTKDAGVFRGHSLIPSPGTPPRTLPVQMGLYEGLFSTPLLSLGWRKTRALGLAPSGSHLTWALGDLPAALMTSLPEAQNQALGVHF